MVKRVKKRNLEKIASSSKMGSILNTPFSLTPQTCCLKLHKTKGGIQKKKSHSQESVERHYGKHVASAFHKLSCTSCSTSANRLKHINKYNNLLLIARHFEMVLQSVFQSEGLDRFQFLQYCATTIKNKQEHNYSGLRTRMKYAEIIHAINDLKKGKKITDEEKKAQAMMKLHQAKILATVFKTAQNVRKGTLFPKLDEVTTIKQRLFLYAYLFEGLQNYEFDNLFSRLDLKMEVQV